MLFPEIFTIILEFDNSEYDFSKFLSGTELERYNDILKEYKEKEEQILSE